MDLRLTERPFRKSNGGNVAVLFSLLLVPIIGAGSLAVDYACGLYVREAMETAADAAALASKADVSLSKAQAEAKAEQYFRVNTASLSMVGPAKLDIKATDESVIVKARAKRDTTLAAVLGTKYQWVEVTSQAVSSTDDLELALVLDNTGSMADHMDELRTGANALVDTLFESSGSASKMKVVWFLMWGRSTSATTIAT